MKSFFSIAAVFVIVFSADGLYAQKNESGARFLNHNLHVSVDKFSHTLTRTVEIVILDEAGDNYSLVSIPYSKGNKVKIHYARIEDMSGKEIRKFKKREVATSSLTSDAQFYSDYLVKHFRLRHNVFPYKVVYSYSVTSDKYLHIADIEIAVNAPIENGVLTVEAPVDLKVKYDYGNVGKPEINSVEGITSYKWQYSYSPVERQVMAPEESLGNPYITVVSEKFNYGVGGEFTSWESFGNWEYRLNDNLDLLPESERRTVDRIIAGMTSDYEKVKALYYYLQDNHRYVSITKDIGGLKSYPADYVCRNRYGDCKALSNYMRALLSYAGIKSYYTSVMLDTEKPRTLREDFPNQAFNHVILVVPVEGDTVFVECTSRHSPFGYIHTQIQGRQALMSDRTDSRLINIPELRPEYVECRYEYDIKLAEGGAAHMDINYLLRGREFEIINNAYHGINERVLSDYIGNNIFSGSYVFDGYEISKTSRDADSINLRAGADFTGFYKIYDKDMLVDNIPFKLLSFEKPSERKYGVRINYPLNEVYLLSYDLAGYDVAELPEDKEIESRFGKYGLKFSFDEGRLIVKKSITLYSGDCSIEEYEDFFNFISGIKKSESAKLNLKLL